MYIPIILGTAREGRQSEKVADFMLLGVEKRDLETEIIDVRDFGMTATDDSGESAEAQDLVERIKKADGLIIVTPEYNHGYPGELKLMLDMVYEEYSAKPVGFCGVSSEAAGAARAIEQLKLVSIELHMVPIRESLYFPMIEDFFDPNGQAKNKEFNKHIEVFLNELIWYARVLKKPRES